MVGAAAPDGRPFPAASVPSFEVEIAGPPGSVSLEEFLRVLGHANAILREVDAVVTGVARGSLRWYITDLRMGSCLATVQPTPRPGRTLHLVNDVVDATVSGLREVELQASLPPAFTPDTLERVRKLSRSLTKTTPTFKARVLNSDKVVRSEATITGHAAVNVGAALEIRSRTLGSLIGRLEKISVHNKPTFSIYTPRTRRAVICDFGGLEEEMLDRVKAQLGHRVSATGRINRNRLGQPINILITGMEPLGDGGRLADLAGLIPDITGGREAVEYVRTLREA